MLIFQTQIRNTTFGVVSNLATAYKNNNAEVEFSAYDETKERDYYSTVSERTLPGGTMSLTFNGGGEYYAHNFQEKYTAHDALIYNYAVSVRPDMLNNYVSPDGEPQNRGVTVWGKNYDGSFYMSLDFLCEQQTVAGLDKDMSVDEFFAHVKESELDKNINWTNVENNLSFDVGDVNSTTFSDYTSYAAAVYAVLESQIKNDFTGYEQKAQLDKLNQVFNAKTEAFKEIFYNQSLLWLEAYEGEGYIKGQSEERLKASIDNVFRQKINNYKKIINTNSDYARIKGSDYEWLKRDVRFMASSLVEAGKDGSVNFENGLISEKDLVDMSALSEAFNSKETAYRGGIYHVFTDEETFGFILGTKLLKAFYTADQMEVSEKVRETLVKMANKFIENELDKMQKATEFETEMTFLTKSQFRELDKDAVLHIANNLLYEYSSSKDPITALQKTAAYAYKLHMQKADMPEYQNLLRYGSKSENGVIFHQGGGNNIWNNFYELKQPETNPNDPYSVEKSRICMLNVLREWGRFVGECL